MELWLALLVRPLVGPGSCQGAHRGGVEDGALRVVGQHLAEDLLEGKKMDAGTPALEVVVRAMPPAGVEADVMRVVVTTERQGNALDRDAVHLAGVAVRLLDLADERGVHRRGTSSRPTGRHRGPPSGRCAGR